MLSRKGCNKTISTMGAEVKIETNRSQTSKVKGVTIYDSRKNSYCFYYYYG